MLTGLAGLWEELLCVATSPLCANRMMFALIQQVTARAVQQEDHLDRNLEARHARPCCHLQFKCCYHSSLSLD